jgi:hypothetical protein
MAILSADENQSWIADRGIHGARHHSGSLHLAIKITAWDLNRWAGWWRLGA